MNFSEHPKREITENIVPMINVVFLLLIFFLMTAQIVPPEPLAVAPPESADGQVADGTTTLFLSASSEIAFEDFRGEAALAEFATHADGLIRVDAALPATDLAKALADLRVLGVSGVGVITVTP